MLDDDHYTDLDISDVVDDSEHFVATDCIKNENLDPPEDIEEANVATDSEILNSEDQTASPVQSEDKKVNPQKNESIRGTKLPAARIKHIMKMDPDVHLVSAEAVFLVTKATELFLETITKETYNANKKKKIVTKKDLEFVINTVDCLCFLEGAMDF